MSTQQNRQIRELVDGLSQRPDRPMPTLRPEEPRGGIPSRRGYVERAYQPGSGRGTAGIASPLVEGAVPPELNPTNPVLEREYYPGGLVSSDGLFVLPALKKITMRDANGAPVVFEFAEPGTDDE